jgi:hypothetical protein
VIFFNVDWDFFGAEKPVGRPSLMDADSETAWMYFLTQGPSPFLLIEDRRVRQ